MKLHRTRSRTRLAAIFLPSAIALAACGGSDDPAPAGPDGPTLTLTGTAATGAAIAGGTVDAKCDGGDGSTTTAPDGSYRIALDQGALPCLLRVTKDGNVLHSLATGSGSSATANVTPVSELVVAYLAGGSPADFFASFETAPSAAQVQAAVDAVVATLKSAGVDFSGIDVLGGTLVAANGSNAGNAFDQALEVLNAKLEDAGVTLEVLRDTVVRESPAAPPAALNATPSLPAELLLRAAAPNCSALRSGKYRVVFFNPGDGGNAATDTIMLDAPTLTVTSPGEEPSALTADGECRYKLPNGGELVVSQAGVGVFRSLENGTYRIAMSLPEQTHPVAALAGTWNYMGLGDNNGTGGTASLSVGELTVDATGRATAGVFCEPLLTCAAETPDARQTFVANAQGGFDFDGSRAFAYRSGGGELMVVMVAPDGYSVVATRKVARALPSIGTVNRSWNLTLARTYTAAGAPTDSENTTVSHAGDGLSWTRTSIIDFANNVTRPETIQINVPREGFNRRVPEMVTASNGASSNVSEWIALTLRGIGITPVALPGPQQLVFSVTKP